jgi:hypothetical protein
MNKVLKQALIILGLNITVALLIGVTAGELTPVIRPELG